MLFRSEGYVEANADAVGTADRLELHRYMEEDFADELKKITDALEL